MGDPVPVGRLTVEEYLEFEARSDARYEYVDGFVFATTGESKRHNRVVRNLARALEDHLAGGPCEIYTSNVRVRVEPARAFYYPDIVVACDPSDDDDYCVERLLLLIEVLSPGTESTDRREKRPNYSKLKSLREYALVAQDRMQVEIHRFSEDRAWEQVTFTDGAAAFASIELSLPLAAIYSGLDAA